MRVSIAAFLILAVSMGLAHAQAAPQTGAASAPAVADVESVASTVTICVDRAGRQCWTALGSTRCHTASRPTAEVFAMVPAEAPEEHLLSCMQSLEP